MQYTAAVCQGKAASDGVEYQKTNAIRKRKGRLGPKNGGELKTSLSPHKEPKEMGWPLISHFDILVASP
ncbi:unnamed protein product [Nippostrongylus brasiliensis]|uniref:Uncharacterized protein n=1 Tax=Nippostrongylus brasiliensis TaxID=27835 RepID=A0A0N4Y9J3_NIPBR|nr:unnamed protein product [Nippostrongylus brasiliensis]